MRRLRRVLSGARPNPKGSTGPGATSLQRCLHNSKDPINNSAIAFHSASQLKSGMYPTEAPATSRRKGGLEIWDMNGSTVRHEEYDREEHEPIAVAMV